MCHECDDEDNDDVKEFNINMIPEEEREGFMDYAQEQFHSIIEKASQHDVLFDLITEWPQAKQAMFTFTVIMENRMFNQDDN